MFAENCNFRLRNKEYILKITVKNSGEGKSMVAGSKTVQISLGKHKKLREKYVKLLGTEQLTLLVA